MGLVAALAAVSVVALVVVGEGGDIMDTFGNRF
jgi:hypothetical protein